MRPDRESPIVLAAVDDDPVAGAVLHVATALAQTLAATIEVVHVGDTLPSGLRATVERSGHDLRLLDGDSVEALTSELQRADVRLAVIGCRGRPAGPRPAGHVSLAVLERAITPVVVVPPDTPAAHRDLTVVLLPLDGSDETAAAVDPTMRLLTGAGLKVIVAHVFDAATVPAFQDDPYHAMQAWGHEFLARHADTDLELVLRSGPPGTRLLDVMEAEDVDLVVLGWSQRLAADRARTIRELLSRSPVPLLLVPVEGIDPPMSRTGVAGSDAR